MSAASKQLNHYLGPAIGISLVVVPLALAGISVATNPYDSGPVGAVKRHFPVSKSDLYFNDYSRNGSESQQKCTTGPDLTAGERLIVTAANGVVMGTFPFEYTGGTPSRDPNALCVYRADISRLPSGQGTYEFTILPNPRILISCTESQLQSVALSYTKQTQSGSCTDKKNSSEEKVWVAPPWS